MPFDVMAAVKWLAGLALAALIFFGGRSCGVEAGREGSADDLQDASEALIEARDQLRGCATSLNFANEQALVNQRQARQAQEEAASAVVAAQEAGKVYARELGELEAELEAAKADPDCRRVLESATCAVLR